MSIFLHHTVHVGHPRTKTILTYLEHYTVLHTVYGRPFVQLFEKPGLSNEKPGLSNEKPGFSIDNPGLSTINRKSWIFKVKKNMEYTVQMAFHIRGQWPV